MSLSAEPGRRSSGAAAGRVRDIPLATATADRASTIGPSTAKYRVHRPAALSLAGCSGRRVRRHVADIRDPTLTSRLGAGSSEHRPSRAGHVPVSGRRQRRASDAFEDWRSPRARRHRHCGVASAPGRAVDSQLRPRRLVHRESALRRSGWERGIDGSPCPGSGRAATSGRLAAGMACLQRVELRRRRAAASEQRTSYDGYPAMSPSTWPAQADPTRPSRSKARAVGRRT